MTTTYTSHYRLPKPAFDAPTWHVELNAALSAIDALIYEHLQLSGVIGAWAISTAYTVGQRVVDTVLDTVYMCLVAHTSSASGTFSAYRVANPTHWVAASLSLTPRGAWAKNTAYAYYDLAYQASEGVFALCVTAHTSSNGGADTIRTDAVKWAFISDLSLSGEAASVSFDNATTGFAATDVQAVIDEFWTAMIAALALKATIASPTFTGVPAAPTAAGGVSSTQLATCAFVASAVAPLAPKASPAFTGVPTAPTAALANNSTQLATTAYVDRATSPLGAVIMYAGLTEPTGWIFLFGQSLSRTTYAALFTLLGTTYGVGDGATTFGVPDLRGRVVAGQDDMGGTSANRLTGLVGGVDGDTLGASGGVETHTLVTAEMPSHTHANVRQKTSDTLGSESAAGSTSPATAQLITNATGGGGAHNNVQPSFILNYIMFAGV